MPRGDKSKYSSKQKRQAEHIEEGYKDRGISQDEAERRAWATVNKSTGGGKKSGSGLLREKGVRRAGAQGLGVRAPVSPLRKENESPKAKLRVLVVNKNTTKTPGGVGEILRNPMARAIWKGSINFGLVTIPVALHSAEERKDLSFRLLDRRNLSPVRYKRVSEKTGREVPWDEIVKGYEHRDERYVVLTEEDFRRANVEATQTVEITGFVDASEIDPVYYDKPYYLEPLKKARKSYALLREVLKRTGKVGIGKIVIRTKQYLAAVLVWGPALVVNLLRYAYELRDPAELDLPPQSLKTLAITEKEIKLAERLVEAMIEPWEPAKYTDTYRDELLAVIDKKAKSGATEAIEKLPKEIPQRRTAQVVDIMDLLKRSVEKAKEEAPSRKRIERRRKAG